MTSTPMPIKMPVRKRSCFIEPPIFKIIVLSLGRKGKQDCFRFALVYLFYIQYSGAKHDDFRASLGSDQRISLARIQGIQKCRKGIQGSFGETGEILQKQDQQNKRKNIPKRFGVSARQGRGSIQRHLHPWKYP